MGNGRSGGMNEHGEGGLGQHLELLRGGPAQTCLHQALPLRHPHRRQRLVRQFVEKASTGEWNVTSSSAPIDYALFYFSG